jgi:septal ring factor EnvC (AmiA/AmiB activator)
MIEKTNDIFKRSGALFCLAAAVCLMLFCVTPEVSAQKRKQNSKGKRVLKQQPKKKTRVSTRRQASSTQAAQKELLKVQSEIKKTRSQINSLSKKETSTAKKLAVHEKHSSQIVRHIDLLENQVAVLKSEITSAKRNEQMLLTRLQQIQQSYSKIAQEFYKAGELTSDELMVTGRPSDVDVRRKAYMKALTQRLNEQVHQMAEVKDSIARQQQLLKAHTDEQNHVLKTKAAEQQQLERSISEKKKALDEIRTNKQLLSQELAKKEQSARQIGSMINRLIAEESRKRREARSKERAQRQEESRKKREERIADRKKSEKGPDKTPTKGEPRDLASNDVSVDKIENDAPDYTRSSFKTNSLAWPVGSRRILRGFGQYRNPSTNTVTDNPGIDIAASKGSGVKAVSSGVVSLLHWLPGYGSLVIIDHENGFRSVYANLSSVSVREGQKVSGGSMIGRSGESVDGEFLHFELWRERQRLNPTSWLN